MQGIFHAGQVLSFCGLQDGKLRLVCNAWVFRPFQPGERKIFLRLCGSEHSSLKTMRLRTCPAGNILCIFPYRDTVSVRP